MSCNDWDTDYFGYFIRRLTCCCLSMYSINMKKNNFPRVVIITGGTSGIGLESARMFHNNGDIVYPLARKKPEGNEQVLENFISLDVADEEAVKNCFAQISEKHGRIDLLINNAGYGMSGITELTETADAKRLFDVNVFGVHICTKYALPFMQKGSRIINISSVAGIFPVPFRAFYGASKAAVTALTFAQRGELKPLGIQVAAISPGNTKTGFTKNRPKSFATNERYGDRMQRATEHIDKGDDKRMPASVVAKRIFKLSRKRKMPPQIIVGGGMKITYFASRFLPVSWMRGIVDSQTTKG